MSSVTQKVKQIDKVLLFNSQKERKNQLNEKKVTYAQFREKEEYLQSEVARLEEEERMNKERVILLCL